MIDDSVEVSGVGGEQNKHTSFGAGVIFLSDESDRVSEKVLDFSATEGTEFASSESLLGPLLFC